MEKWMIFPLMLLLIIVKGGDAYRSSEDCSKVNRTMAAFINDRELPDVLYSLLEKELMVTDKLISDLEGSSGYSFSTNAEDRHDMACEITRAGSRRELAGVLGVSRGTVEGYYNTILTPIHQVGGIDHMNNLATVVDILFTWAVQSGYPVGPFRIDSTATLKTFETVKKWMTKKYIHDVLINAPFPLKVTPTEALQHLKELKTAGNEGYSTFEIAVFMDPHQLKDFASYVERDINVLIRGSKNVQSTMALLTALDQTGVLALM